DLHARLRATVVQLYVVRKNCGKPEDYRRKIRRYCRRRGRLMALSIRLLRIFRAVARQGGIAPAARVLNLSPAAVSEAVSDLEAMLGKPLFERTMKRLRLNAAGAALLPRAENVLTDVDDIERDLRSQRVRLE